MNKDEATKIARRILDRVEQDRALHLDSLVEEIMAGMAIKPQAFEGAGDWSWPTSANMVVVTCGDYTAIRRDIYGLMKDG
jgi:hypothetical protein